MPIYTSCIILSHKNKIHFSFLLFDNTNLVQVVWKIIFRITMPSNTHSVSYHFHLYMLHRNNPSNISPCTLSNQNSHPHVPLKYQGTFTCATFTNRFLLQDVDAFLFQTHPPDSSFKYHSVASFGSNPGKYSHPIFSA